MMAIDLRNSFMCISVPNGTMIRDSDILKTWDSMIGIPPPPPHISDDEMKRIMNIMKSIPKPPPLDIDMRGARLVASPYITIPIQHNKKVNYRLRGSRRKC